MVLTIVNPHRGQDAPEHPESAAPGHAEHPLNLEPMLRPRTVAIIGASNEPGRLAGMTLKFLKDAGFGGEIWPVNPNRDVVQGFKSYRSVASLPATPDVAIIVVPAALVKQAVEQCAERGVKYAMIFAAGLSEAGDPETQTAITDIASKAGMRLLGPNCLGCFNSETNFYGTFAIALNAGFHRPGNIAMVSQSGAYGEQTCYLARERGLGIRYFISTGNEADITIGDAIDWLAGRDEIDVILAYAEGIRDAERLKAGLARAQAAGKKIIFVKVGRSERGAAAATSHTAALAGNDSAWDAVFRKYGVCRVSSSEEQVDIAYAASRGLFPSGRKLGILSVSGGYGIQLCDAAAEMGLQVAVLPEPVAEKLRVLLPFGSIQNPLDASGQVTAHLHQLRESLKLLAHEANYDAVIAFFGTIPLVPAMSTPLLDAIRDAAGDLSGRLVVLSLVGDEETVRAYEEAGYLVFPDTYRAVRAISALATLAGHGEEPEPAKAPPSPHATSRTAALSEHQAKKYLAASGIPVLPEHLAASASEAANAARALGFPVALKICGSSILHKSDIGGVLLSLANEADVLAGYELLIQRAQAAGYGPGEIEGVIVAPMAPRGIETILGVKNDPNFGPVVLFGLGGIYSEIFKDFATSLAPVSVEEAHAMIRRISAWPLLQGARGAPPADVGALAQAISDLSHFAVANAEEISEIDINPFVVWDENKGATALDALIALKAPAEA